MVLLFILWFTQIVITLSRKAKKDSGWVELWTNWYVRQWHCLPTEKNPLCSLPYLVVAISVEMFNEIYLLKKWKILQYQSHKDNKSVYLPHLIFLVLFWDRLIGLKERQGKMCLWRLCVLLLFSRIVGNVSYPVQILEFPDLLTSKSASAFFEEGVPLYS